MISDTYRKQQSDIHKNSNWGANSRSKNPKVFNIPDLINTYNIKSLLDFGCGQGGLHAHLKSAHDLEIAEGYDPCVSKFDKMPAGVFDMLVSFDVLEHIEPEYINDTLKLINSKFTNIAFLNIHTTKANLILPDGRNAHLIQEQPDWWQKKINAFIDGKIIDEFWLPYNKNKHSSPVNYVFVIKKNAG
jgi:cyclopropane fatty-acyl-phospholipid synthase-like methyltransferase